MKIRILGAGPAGLYFAALMKCLDPSHDIAIFDRNSRDATWGFGVVFSDRALEFLRADDEALYQYLTPTWKTGRTSPSSTTTRRFRSPATASLPSAASSC